MLYGNVFNNGSGSVSVMYVYRKSITTLKTFSYRVAMFRCRFPHVFGKGLSKRLEHETKRYKNVSM